MNPTLNKVPHHIGIIIDGNRRFSKRLMMKPWKGHEWGGKKVEALMEWCQEFGINELTIYAFSMENFKRPKREFDYLMNLFLKEFKRVSEDTRLGEKDLRINFIGRIELFPDQVQAAMKELMEKTKHNSKYTINFAMAYGGRTEVVDAAKKIAEKVKKGDLDINQINEESFSENLYLNSDPDLVIRTSESRLSGFLPWQSVYAEIIFLPDVLWPEFTKEHFIACLQQYQSRDRRFGGNSA